MQKKAIVLYSGGLDSTTCLAMARADGFTPYALSFRYGQRHSVELEKAKAFAPQIGAEQHLIVDIDLRQIGGSALTADIEVPKDRPIDDEIPITYVPARNTIFLSYALAWAQVVGAFDIYIGVNALDYSGYPDCRPEFIEAYQTMANLATKAGVEGGGYTIHTPLLRLTKAEIIRQGSALGVDYGLTHSCYDPTAQGEACGRCDSCLLRLKGFAEAGLSDPVPYAEGVLMAAKSMPDMQQSADTRNIAIDKVGIKDVRYPIVVQDKNNTSQQTVANINMYVELPHQFKGTHMSRFLEILNQYHQDFAIGDMHDILSEMKRRLESNCAHIEVKFPYFIEKQAPVSKAKGLMEYECRFIGTLRETTDFVLEVSVPVTSLCPCSREISQYGAHNQRSCITVAVRSNRMVWIEDLISWVEGCGSAPVYSLLKREDEKAVTEQAYENPMFVEDIVRAVTEKLRTIDAIDWFCVECENYESIHNHSAYATLEHQRLGR